MLNQYELIIFHLFAYGQASENEEQREHAVQSTCNGYGYQHACQG